MLGIKSEAFGRFFGRYALWCLVLTLICVVCAYLCFEYLFATYAYGFRMWVPVVFGLVSLLSQYICCLVVAGKSKIGFERVMMIDNALKMFIYLVLAGILMYCYPHAVTAVGIEVLVLYLLFLVFDSVWRIRLIKVGK